MLLDQINAFSLILASQSPRRHHLLKEAGLEFKISSLHEVEESYPSGLDKFEIPVYLSDLKSRAYSDTLLDNEILITADTIVWFENEVINKPESRNDALKILGRLSGKTHEVITGVSLRSKEKMRSFYSHSMVTFTTLSETEINFYIDKYRPFDKAGAYGIQEWIGYVGISRIEGSFFNVMGMPIQQLYHELGEFIK